MKNFNDFNDFNDLDFFDPFQMANEKRKNDQKNDNLKTQLLIDLKGEPGKNCGGFCKFCYFRKVSFKNPEPLGCNQCTYHIGCDYCTNSIREINGDFIPLPFAIQQIQDSLMFKRYDKINITSGGDTSYYPYLEELCREIASMGLNIHLGYTSGKGIKSLQSAKNMVDCGVDEVTFSVFSTDSELRKEWMNDKTPEISIECLKHFCKNCETHCAIVVVPGVNDGEVLKKTIADLIDWGANAIILMRFANKIENGLIFGNEPLIEGIDVQTMDEFRAVVEEMYNLYGNQIRLSGTPVYDPITDTPFAILKDDETIMELRKSIRSEATIITGSVSYTFLSKIFKDTPINVIKVNKDISDLITKKDLEEINLNELKETVLIPSRALVHDRDMEEILKKDGVDRIVLRGVDKLTLDGEVSGVYTKEQAIEFEKECFTELIEKINFFGSPIKNN
ncbi:methanogenesis marker radical SAM protein [Methanococcus voltae]|uniref:Methanogenesis marker radical SAM protein n=2 Tax=Methanococcus voltae TaxID=2188 RepID=A0A8J7S3I5_METVO|nr:methanogenesis marker radical SAM protein [Methanococcus voltae]MBP2200850.1 methanogenesis marker radical SAM protein [Methanococcus voltae]